MKKARQALSDSPENRRASTLLLQFGRQGERLSGRNDPFIPVGVFGGTFDPIHYGHLRSALELSERLELAQLRLMPCAMPPHRELTQCSAQQRAAMVELAVAGESRLMCDTRELQRSGPSYTIDSLIELRQELGEQTSLSLIMGCDALLDIDSWYRWKEILDWAQKIH